MSAEANLGELLTEMRNPRSAEIDALPTEQLLRVINAEDATVAERVADVIPHIAAAVDAITERIQQGGRLYYIGAGTSGRLAVLDASECPPTYSVPRDMVQGLIAGGDPALRVSAEGAEDSREQGALDLVANGFGQSTGRSGVQDILVGIAASGRTPYVLGAMAYARSTGALVVGLSCVPGSPVEQAADIALTPATGPEVITGSTRMKAGTATKLVLNMLSTGLMVKLGYVLGNLMVNVAPTNAKLVDRGERIVAAAAEVPRDRAAQLLREAGSVKVAIVMGARNVSRDEAEAKLRAANGVLRAALDNGTRTIKL